MTISHLPLAMRIGKSYVCAAMKIITFFFACAALVFSASAQLTGEARILKEKRDAKIAEIDKIYKEQLAKLKTKALENRDVAAAEAIQAEIDGGKSQGTFPTGGAVDFTKSTRWTWGSGGVLTLRKDGVAQHTEWTKDGSWRTLASGGIVIKSYAGVTFDVTFDENGKGRVSCDKNGAETTLVRR